MFLFCLGVVFLFSKRNHLDVAFTVMSIRQPNTGVPQLKYRDHYHGNIAFAFSSTHKS